MEAHARIDCISYRKQREPLAQRLILKGGTGMRYWGWLVLLGLLLAAVHTGNHSALAAFVRPAGTGPKDPPLIY